MVEEEAFVPVAASKLQVFGFDFGAMKGRSAIIGELSAIDNPVCQLTIQFVNR